MQIIQIPPGENVEMIQTKIPFRYTPAKYYRSRRSYRSCSHATPPIIMDHANPRISMDHAIPPINVCRSCRSYRPHPGQDKHMIQITQIPLSQVDHTDPADHTYAQTTQIKFPVKYTHVEYLPHTDPILAKRDVNNCEVSRFTNPADDTKILQVPTQVHTCEISTSSYRFYPVKLYRSHTSTYPSGTHLPNVRGSADHTIPARHANPPINMCTSYRSYRPHPVQDEQIVRITHIPLCQVDRTDPADHTCVQSIQILQITHRYRSRRSGAHSGTNV